MAAIEVAVVLGLAFVGVTALGVGCVLLRLFDEDAPLDDTAELTEGVRW